MLLKLLGNLFLILAAVRLTSTVELCLDEIVSSSSSPSSTSSDKVLLLDHLHLDKTFVNNILVNYPTLRDFVNSPPYLGPFVHIANFVAGALNSTLVSTTNLTLNCTQKVSKILPTFYNQRNGVQLESIFSRLKETHGDTVSVKAIQRYGMY